jgi:hypothetical protein
MRDAMGHAAARATEMRSGGSAGERRRRLAESAGLTAEAVMTLLAAHKAPP